MSMKTEREVRHVHAVVLNRAGVKQLTQRSSVRNSSQVGNKRNCDIFLWEKMKNMAHFICVLNVGLCFCSLLSEVQYSFCTKCKYFF